MAMISVEVSKGFWNRTVVQLTLEGDPSDTDKFVRMARKALKE